MSNEKKEFPDEGELVLCTVSQISKTSAFVNLDDYNKTGILITAEVAPGRIRNIRDYLSFNKKIVCKVLRVDKEKNHIDLSLRRVSFGEKKDVMERYKKDKDALSILNIVVDKSKIEGILSKIMSEFSSLSEFMSSAKENIDLFKKFGMDKESHQLAELIKERTKIKKINIKSKIKLFSKESQSLTLIKKAFSTNNPFVKITYISSPHYLITVDGREYKEANNILKETLDNITKNLEKIDCYIEVEDE